MSCLGWEERIAAGDREAAQHLRNCPECSALAAGLARDAQLLRRLPPEAAAVDYAALRAAARSEAARRTWRPRILAALAAAAAILLALILPRHQEIVRLEVGGQAPPPPVSAAHVAPPPVRPATPRRRRSQAELDRQFAAFLRAQYEARHPGMPPGTVIATGNPNVSIVLLQESKGNADE
jgi:predicted anti-sigma-YlaC factor YlaD